MQVKKMHRDAALYDMRNKGATYKQIASVFKLSHERIRKILREEEQLHKEE